MTDMFSSAEDRSAGPSSGSIGGAAARRRPRLTIEAGADSSHPDGDSTAGDLELMQAVAAHRASAESELVARVIRLVYSRARSLTRSDADADDATQTSIVEILRSAKSYRGEGRLEGWCERITIRTTLRLQRRQARRLALVDDAVDPDSICEAAPPRKLIEELPGGEIRSYLETLSEDRYQALVLRHVHDYGIEEIAELTEVSPNTVKDRLRMARRQLRQLIRQREFIASVKGGS